jgi:aryl-alcohol dehydrogenase-like predicted oxidoreductase
MTAFAEQRRRLGTSGLMVSPLCLGTMTYGRIVPRSEAHSQLSLAHASGINFLDTAEMYPAPEPDATTFGATETIIGEWLQHSGHRTDMVIATKVAGPAPYTRHIGSGRVRFDLATMREALEGSLRRLRTDYVDLLQLHWPDRHTNALMQLGYVAGDDGAAVPSEETLEGLAVLIGEGKVRAIGISNETPWGLWRFLEAANRLGLPRVASISNAYSLLNRAAEIGLAEFLHREPVSLVAYQPLGMGILSGKYEGEAPARARLVQFPHKRYTSAAARRAATQYVDIAERHGLPPADMAIAFVTSRPFVTSTIIAATELVDLQADIAGAGQALSPAVLAEIAAVHTDNSNPSH